jgi:hypothetical protein
MPHQIGGTVCTFEEKRCSHGWTRIKHGSIRSRHVANRRHLFREKLSDTHDACVAFRRDGPIKQRGHDDGIH